MDLALVGRPLAQTCFCARQKAVREFRNADGLRCFDFFQPFVLLTHGQGFVWICGVKPLILIPACVPAVCAPLQALLFLARHYYLKPRSGFPVYGVNSAGAKSTWIYSPFFAVKVNSNGSLAVVTLDSGE